MIPDRRGGVAATTCIPAVSPDSEDDPRVASALAAYLAELEAGKRPSRGEFLRQPRHRPGSGRLPRCCGIRPRGGRREVLDGADSPLTDALPPNTILGDYRLIREVGRGGMGIVYEAEQVSLGAGSHSRSSPRRGIGPEETPAVPG